MTDFLLKNMSMVLNLSYSWCFCNFSDLIAEIKKGRDFDTQYLNGVRSKSLSLK
jgi:hypothetical protein